MTNSGANPGYLVGCDGDTNAAATNENATISPAVAQSIAYKLGEVRIIRWLCVIRAKICYVPLFILEMLKNRFFQFEASMI